MRERIASLISGGGTTMSEIVQACSSGKIAADMACVIASTAQAGGIVRAKRLGIPDHDVVIVDPTGIGADTFAERLLIELQSRQVTVVLQNGWLPITPKAVIDAFKTRIFNQHPGPIPEFGGKYMWGRRVHAAVLLYRRLTKTEPFTEVIAQYVDPEVDKGAVVKSARVPILPTDTVEDLQQRALIFEHRVQLELLQDILDDNLYTILRPKLVITPEQEQMLVLAKRMARILYPKG